MAVYNKFNQFTKDVVDGRHVFGTHTFKVMLTNTAPAASNQVKTDITEIAAGFGYTAGGPTTTITTSTSAGVAQATASNVTVTAAGGSIGPFRYAVLYNDTQTTPSKPLVGWWDYGSAITLATTEQLTIAFDATNGLFQFS